MSKRIVITVDGLAGTGKTTLSRMLAEKLGFIHFSTGNLYRVVGYLALENNVDLDNGPQLAELIDRNTIELRADGVSALVFLNGQDVSKKLFNPLVSEATSKTARHAEVRNALVDVQRQAFAGRDLVAEGRDMGTVIFPDADLKFFVTASEDVRVERRIKQLGEEALGDNAENSNKLREQMRIEILERDKRDSERDIAPTRAAEDAILVDNSSQTLTQVLENMYASISQAGVLKR